MPSRDRTQSPVWELRPRTISFSDEITPLNSKKLELVQAKAELDKALRQIRDPYDAKHNWFIHNCKLAIEQKKEEVRVMEREERKRREKERLEMEEMERALLQKEREAQYMREEREEEEARKRREEILQNGWWWQRMAQK